MPEGQEPRPARSRVRTACALGGVIALGLGSRSGHPSLPAWCAQDAGDALWTAAAYFALACAWPTASAGSLAGCALGISFAVELSQLVHSSWLDALRSTLPGRLLLGSGWCWADLPRYAVGALVAWGLDRTGVLVPREE